MFRSKLTERIFPFPTAGSAAFIRIRGKMSMSSAAGSVPVQASTAVISLLSSMTASKYRFISISQTAGTAKNSSFHSALTPQSALFHVQAGQEVLMRTASREKSKISTRLSVLTIFRLKEYVFLLVKIRCLKGRLFRPFFHALSAYSENTRKQRRFAVLHHFKHIVELRKLCTELCILRLRQLRDTGA